MNSDPKHASLPLDVAQSFLRTIWALNHAIEARSREMTVRLGVTFQQRTVLRLVGRFPGVTAGKLADTLHVDRGTLSTMLARLEARGLIERRQDTTDRRRVRVGLTSRGRSLDVPDEETVEGAVEEAIHAADPEDVRGTERVLSALVAQLERKQTAVANDTRSRST